MKKGSFWHGTLYFQLRHFNLQPTLHCKMETFLSATNNSEIGYSADYILVYTPAKAQVTNVWFLIENDRLTEKARIIGKGGRIEYLRPDLYDAPGFDANDHRESVPTGLFPQRRVQSSKQLEADFCLFLNGKGDSPTYEYLQGNKGWHILRHEKEGEVQITSLFDSGKVPYLLEIGEKPEQ